MTVPSLDVTVVVDEAPKLMSVSRDVVLRLSPPLAKIGTVSLAPFGDTTFAVETGTLPGSIVEASFMLPNDTVVTSRGMTHERSCSLHTLDNDTVLTVWMDGLRPKRKSWPGCPWDESKRSAKSSANDESAW